MTVDDVVGARRSDVSFSLGACISLAALNRVAPTSKMGFGPWAEWTDSGRLRPVKTEALENWLPVAMYRARATGKSSLETTLVDN